MPTPLDPWVSAMQVAILNIRNHPDLKAVKYHPLLIKGYRPTFVGLPKPPLTYDNDNATQT